MAEVSYDSAELEDWDRETCQAEVERLEAEIALLSEELKQQMEHPRETSLTQLHRLISQTAEDDGTETDRSLVALEKELKLQRSVSGIELTDTTCSILGFSSDKIRRRFSLKGLCSTLPFQISFTVTEKHVEGDKFDAVMTDLSSHVTGDVSPALTSVMKQHEESLSCTDLVHALSTGTQTLEQRQLLYCHLVKKYSYVYLPEGKAGRLLQIQPPNSPKWTIFWSEVVTENCLVEPVIQLFVKASIAMLDRDDNGVIESAPGMFQRMLKTLGPARAIEVFLQTVLSLSWQETLNIKASK